MHHVMCLLTLTERGDRADLTSRYYAVKGIFTYRYLVIAVRKDKERDSAEGRRLSWLDSV